MHPIMAFFRPAPIFNFLLYYEIGTNKKASSFKTGAVGPNWERYRDENSGNRRYCSYEQELTHGYFQNFAQRIILNLYVKKKFVMLLSCTCHAILSSMTALSGLNISPINSLNRLILILLHSQGLTQGALTGSTPNYTYNFRNCSRNFKNYT